MKFKRIAIRQTEVVLETDTGDFPLEALSGGATAIVDTAWQVFLISNYRLRSTTSSRLLGTVVQRREGAKRRDLCSSIVRRRRSRPRAP